MEKKIDLLIAFFIYFLFTVSCLGWAFNIIEIAKSETITGLVIVRCIGVFIAPLGAILGWF